MGSRLGVFRLNRGSVKVFVSGPVTESDSLQGLLDRDLSPVQTGRGLTVIIQNSYAVYPAGVQLGVGVPKAFGNQRSGCLGRHELLFVHTHLPLAVSP